MKKHLILLILFISFFSCKTVKKEWVKENFAEKVTVKESLTVQDSIFKSEIQKIETSVSKLETSVLKFETTKTSETETTNVSGTITAEDGKEKSVTIGGTTIKSNGANISFTTASSNTKEFESRYQELTEQLQEEKQFNQTLQTELISLKSEFANFVSTYQSEKTTKTKEVKKTGFQFGVWIIIAIILIVIILIWYFRKSIPFLSL